MKATLKFSMSFFTALPDSDFIKSQIQEKVGKKKKNKKRSQLLKNKVFGKKTTMKTIFADISKTKT